MKPVTAFDNFPSFANAGTRSAPADAKYAQGMVPADTLPAEWANYFFHGATKGVSDLNSAVRSIWQELQNVLTEYNITPSSDASVINQVYTALTKVYPKITTCDSAANTATKALAITGNVLKTGDVYVVTMTNENSYGDGSTTWPKLSINSGTAYDIVYQDGTKARNGAWKAGEIVKFLFMGDKFLMEANPLSRMYPVGSIYQNKTDPTDPAVLFGVGHWTKITEEFLVAAAAASFTDGTNVPKFNGAASGGSLTRTLTVANLPAHNHEMAHWHNTNINHGHSATTTSSETPSNLGTSAATSDPNRPIHIAMSRDAGDGYWIDGLTILRSQVYTTTVQGTGDDFKGSTNSYYHGGTTERNNTGDTGSGTAIDIIPKYRAVYTWYRDS